MLRHDTTGGGTDGVPLIKQFVEEGLIAQRAAQAWDFHDETTEEGETCRTVNDVA